MIKANVCDKKLVVENFTVSDSVKFDTVRFTFPDDWKDYTKTAVFKTEEGEAINIVLDNTNPLCINENECYIPHEVIKAPHFYLSAFGMLGESVATTTQARVKVLQSGYAEGGAPSDPTPTEYQQLIELATQTKQIAQSVRNDADNDVFKGEKGEKGDRGEQGIQGEKGEKGDTGDVSLKFATDSFASAIKNTLRGEVVTANDVSSVEHNLKVNLESKNLIPFPYTKGTETINGVTFTHNGDGTITVNGTPTENAVHYFRWNTVNPVTFPKGIYTLSGSPRGSKYQSYYIAVNSTLNGTYKDSAVYEGNLTMETDGIRALGIVVKVGNTAENLVFKPQLEKGTTATSWTPYVGELNGVTVSRYSGSDIQGQTVIANADGTVEGLTSVSPDMTLMTNTEGVIINLTYNADTKLYIDNKLSLLNDD